MLQASTQTSQCVCVCVSAWVMRVLQVFEQGQMRGYWRMSYCDAGFRLFYTNKNNLFVLRRTDSNTA